ncbi:PREDICTED: uncharacterized protein LOC107066155 [Polistes dominula]|uniref:Uncharacterized protein LOC107066155 n=1 Tax=Polistes dominula TaxID=743375 RepID=A0ABM1I6Z9_POLDO|nr:PREDICTED: uncharacterized protein LOC107066155 [Polistes dominula]
MAHNETNKMDKSPALESPADISDEAIEAFQNCLERPEKQRNNTYGFIIGGILGSTITIVKRPFQISYLIFPMFGGIYGSIITHYMNSRKCALELFSTDPNSSKFVIRPRKHDSSQLGDSSELNRESQMDIETFQQIDQQEDFPSINDREYQSNANVDVEEKKMLTGLTYDELRKQNRDNYQSNLLGQRKAIWQKQMAVNSNKNKSSQSQDFKSGINEESDLFPSASDTGKHKTKYGDIWD